MLFFLEGIRDVAAAATDKARMIVQLRERDRKTIVDNCGRATASALKLFEGLFTAPIMTVSQAANITGTAYKNTNMLIAQLENLGILAKSANVERNRLFRYREYIQLLDEEEELAGPQTTDDTATLR